MIYFVKPKLLFFTLCLFLSSFSFLSAQSNETIDTFLDQDKADKATSIWLVLFADGQLSEDAQPADALELFSDPRSRVSTHNPEESITFGEFAYIAMETLDLPGGMMYAMFPSPRYAAREFLHRGWIPGKPKTHSELTPWEVTTSLSEILAWKEAAK